MGRGGLMHMVQHNGEDGCALFAVGCGRVSEYELVSKI